MKSSDCPIVVTVSTDYLSDKSNRDDNYYLFNCQVTINNKSDVAVYLVFHRWIMTDGNGHEKETTVSLIKAEQPKIEIGDSFTHIGDVNFSTPLGIIYASYQLQTITGELLDISTPIFRLVVPGALH